MNSVVIPSWKVFHQSPDIIKNAMLIADDITLVVPMNGIDKQELFLYNFNMPQKPSVYDSVDEILRLSNEKIIQIEDGIDKGDTIEDNIRMLYGVNLLNLEIVIDSIYHHNSIMKIARQKKAIILNHESELFKPEGIAERVKFTKSNLLKHCKMNLPDLSRLDYDDIAKFNQKYENEIKDARIYINKLSFDISNDINNESYTDQVKYIEMYVKEVINPRVERMNKIIQNDNDRWMRSIIKNGVKLLVYTFEPITSIIAIPELIKTSLDVSDNLKKEIGNEEGAFLTLMVNSYEKKKPDSGE